MEDTELRERLEALEKKTDDAYKAANTSRKYLLIIMAWSAFAFVLPLIGILLAVPSVFRLYNLGNF